MDKDFYIQSTIGTSHIGGSMCINMYVDDEPERPITWAQKKEIKLFLR